MFTLSNLENFNPRNVKNKKCVHSLANNTSYTSDNDFKYFIKIIER